MAKKNAASRRKTKHRVEAWPKGTTPLQILIGVEKLLQKLKPAEFTLTDRSTEEIDSAWHDRFRNLHAYVWRVYRLRLVTLENKRRLVMDVHRRVDYCTPDEDFDFVDSDSLETGVRFTLTDTDRDAQHTMLRQIAFRMLQDWDYYEDAESGGDRAGDDDDEDDDVEVDASEDEGESLLPPGGLSMAGRDGVGRSEPQPQDSGANRSERPAAARQA